VQVSYSEGLANHTGPESCAGIREDAGEALTGERIGQPSSRESLIFPDADVVRITEGNMGGAITRAPAQSGVVEDPEHVRKLFAREPGGLGFGRRMDIAIPVGIEPFGVAVTPDGRWVYVTNFFANTVSVIDTVTKMVIDTIPVVRVPPSARTASIVERRMVDMPTL
jgi:YVTN family beta-propeller protein